MPGGYHHDEEYSSATLEQKTSRPSNGVSLARERCFHGRLPSFLESRLLMTRSWDFPCCSFSTPVEIDPDCVRRRLDDTELTFRQEASRAHRPTNWDHLVPDHRPVVPEGGARRSPSDPDRRCILSGSRGGAFHPMSEIRTATCPERIVVCAGSGRLIRLRHHHTPGPTLNSIRGSPARSLARRLSAHR